jgi:hypothetical protein
MEDVWDEYGFIQDTVYRLRGFPEYFGAEYVNWQPTRNIAQAWECLQKLGYEYKLYSTNGSHGCVVWPFAADYDYISEADSAAEAIVRACLRAKGVDV